MENSYKLGLYQLGKNIILLSLIGMILPSLIVFGVIVGILYSDVFGVIKGIGNLMGQIGDAGLSGLVALALIATWYKK